MLVGRKPHRKRLHGLLADARAGRAGTLVLRGEAGIGKTALLDDLATAAAPSPVVWVRGVESEQEIPFVGLLAACRPFLHALAALPDWQADALRGALALAPAEGPGRLAVGAGTLSLLGAAAAEEPLLLIVDDAQWLDPSSAEALLFAARRFEFDPIAMVFAVRDGEPEFPAAGIEELRVEGLVPDEAAELIASVPERCTPSVVRTLVDMSAGNPLVLLELPRTLEEDQRLGRRPLYEPVRVSTRVEQSFERRAAALGEPARRGLVIAAAAGGDLAEITRALAACGLDSGPIEAAEDAGLIEIRDGALRFRHPLMRSAVYHAAARSERRAAHQALASVYAKIDMERQAWHLAMAAVGQDEEAAALLEESGRRSAERGAHLSAANAFERAARLGDAGNAARVRRLLAAAVAAWAAGEAPRADALVAEGIAVSIGGELQADLVALRGRVVSRVGDQERAFAAFIEAADITNDLTRQATFLGEAALAAVQLSSSQLDQVDARLRKLRGGHDPQTDLLVAIAHTAADSVAGVGEPNAWRERAEDAVERLLQASPSAQDLLSAGYARLMFGHNHDASMLATRGILRLRRGEAANILAELLRLRASADADRGAWPNAYASAAEAVEIAEELGLDSIACACLGLLAELDASTDNADACRNHARRAIDIAVRNRLSFFRERAERALGRLEILTGDIHLGVERLEAVAERLRHAGNHELNVSPVPDLVDAYVRLGDIQQAEVALYRLPLYPAGLLPNEEAVIRRCRGLVAPEDQYRAELERAVEISMTEPFPFERARTQLALGERLRRTGERRAAREQLRKARTTFADLGASAWTKRTDAELEASGARRAPQGESHINLTPRESQIAFQLSEGKSNKEIAAALYLTPKTVEFHLTRIYRKLGVRTRAQLTTVLRDSA